MLGYRPLWGLNGQMHMPSKIEKKQAAAKLRKPPRDFSYTQNRELSWLRFDNRVLDEAFDETVPLFERLKFVSIFESNLDEFLMVRSGGAQKTTCRQQEQYDRLRTGRCCHGRNARAPYPLGVHL